MKTTFKDRRDAGYQLGRALEQFSAEDPIMLAIPRGGVVVGYYASELLKCVFSIIICRKLGYTAQPELAFGAIAEGRSLYLDPRVRIRITKNEITKIIEKEEHELQRRVEVYRNNQPLPDIRNQTVIIVDDGIATGGTIMAAIDACRKRKPAKIIVAAPVASADVKRRLQKVADEVIILKLPDYFYAVSQAYDEFFPVEDEEVLDYMTKVSQKRSSVD